MAATRSVVKRRGQSMGKEGRSTLTCCTLYGPHKPGQQAPLWIRNESSLLNGTRCPGSLWDTSSKYGHFISYSILHFPIAVFAARCKLLTERENLTINLYQSTWQHYKKALAGNSWKQLVHVHHKVAKRLKKEQTVLSALNIAFI